MEKDLTYDNEKRKRIHSKPRSIPGVYQRNQQISILQYNDEDSLWKNIFIIILGSCVFRVIWVYTIFAYFRTITSLYLLYIFSWTITGAAEILYFRHGYKTLQISQK